MFYFWDLTTRPTNDEDDSYGYRKILPIVVDNNIKNFPNNTVNEKDFQKSKFVRSIDIDRTYKGPLTYSISITIDFVEHAKFNEFLQNLKQHHPNVFNDARSGGSYGNEVWLEYSNITKSQLKNLKNNIVDFVSELDKIADIHTLLLDEISVRLNLPVLLGQEKIQRKKDMQDRLSL